MKATAVASSSCSSVRASALRPACRPCARPFTASRVPVQPRREVQAHFFKFGGNSKPENKSGSIADSTDDYPVAQKREDYSAMDAEDYFSYMGFLAVEQTYDRLFALLKDREPIDVILLLCAYENDKNKLEEVLGNGADTSVKDLDGKTALDLTSKPELKQLIQGYMDNKKKATVKA